MVDKRRKAEGAKETRSREGKKEEKKKKNKRRKRRETGKGREPPQKIKPFLQSST
jgi:hypothetical protein